MLVSSLTFHSPTRFPPPTPTRTHSTPTQSMLANCYARLDRRGGWEGGGCTIDDTLTCILMSETVETQHKTMPVTDQDAICAYMFTRLTVSKQPFNTGCLSTNSISLSNQIPWGINVVFNFKGMQPKTQ